MNSPWNSRNIQVVVCVVCMTCVLGLASALVSCGGGGKTTSMTTGATGMVNVSISDPPSCMPPNGQYMHVYVTVRSVQANIDPNASDSSSSWQELAPQLAGAPMQIDLFSKPQTTCVLAQLGSASLPVGMYQQIRLILVSNTPAASDAVPSSNACAGQGFNCVVLEDSSIHQLELSSEDKTGLKIPPGQVVGGPIQVSAGQSVDLNIDFNACASIVREGSGKYRLKPTLTAGQVSTNNSGIGGQVVDSVTKQPIKGSVQVAIEQQDSAGVDRIVMQMVADGNGNFRFCPLPTGIFDIVIVGIGPANLPYNATAVLSVPNGANLGTIPLVAETGASAPAVLQGVVTATNGSSPSTIDVGLSALESVPNGSSSLQITIPLQTIPATNTTPEVDSTATIAVSDATACPATGAPKNANCASYTLVVPASNPSVGVFSSSGFSFSTPASGDVLFTVDAHAVKPNSGGAPSCTPPAQMVSKDSASQPLKVLPATTTNVAEIDFAGCS